MVTLAQITKMICPPTSGTSQLFMTKYRPDIDGLRAVAVLAVLLFHAFPKVLPSGFIGVDVFFVISGYLISSIIISQLLEGRFSLARFYSRRISRIFPALIIVIGVSYGLGLLFLSPPELGKLGRHISAGAIFLSNFLLRSEAGYFDDGAIEKPMLHLWSLSIEEQFYILWPLLLMVWVVFRLNLLILIVLGCGASFAHEVMLVGDGTASAFYLPTARFWELMVGAFVACLHLALEQQEDPSAPKSGRYSFPTWMSKVCRGIYRRSNIVSSLGSLLLIAGLWIIREGEDFPGSIALLPVIGTALMIAGGARSALSRRVLSARWLVGIGLISYPLYLWHWPLLSLVHLNSASRGELEASVTLRLAVLIASAVLSWLVYKVVETPIRHGGRVALKVSTLVVMMALVGSAGHYAHLKASISGASVDLAQVFYTYRFKQFDEWRVGECFFESQQLANRLDFDKCTAISPHPQAPRVLLWGDSHAAHLYRGLTSIFQERITLTQITLGKCGAYLLENSTSAACIDHNKRVLAWIKSSKPDVVILAADWVEGAGRVLPTTIRTLKEAGIKNIIIVGQVVEWSKPAFVMVGDSIANDPLHRVQKRFATGFKTEDKTENPNLREIAKQFGITFLSPYDLFCNDKGCLIVTGETPDTMISMDRSHLAITGASILVRGFPKF